MKKMLVVASMVMMLNTNVYANINDITIATDGSNVIRAGYMPTVEVVDSMDVNKNGITTDTIKMNVLGQGNNTAKFNIIEYAEGTIDVEKPITITLPEGITITGIIIESDKVLYDGKGYEQARKTYGLKENEFELESSAAFEKVVQFDDNEVTIKNGEFVGNGNLGNVRISLFVKTPYNYNGDIDVTVSGEGIGGVANTVSVAKVIQIVDVDTAVSNVSKGESVANDIAISEVVGGSFKLGEVVEVELGDDATFEGMPTVKVKGGTLKGKAKLSGDKTKLIVTLDGKATSSDVGVITLSNVKVNTNNVAVDNVVDIIVTSDNAITNPIKLAYVFVEKGDGTEVVEENVDVTEGSNIEGSNIEENNNNEVVTDSKFNKNVVFTVGQKNVSIDGEVKEISYAPYVSKKSGSTMIPLRALAEALGIPSEHILWYQPTKTATIIVDDTTVAQFSIDSKVCYINANSVPMTSASGVVDVTEYKDGAVFLPMRFLSEVVFKVPVGWDKARPNEIVFN